LSNYKNRKDSDKHIKYKYLIWKSGEGFVHLDSFSKEELATFAEDMQKVLVLNEEKNSKK
jgi:predicted ATP-grasp superfamily ATP-dependent carboligase